MYQMRINYLAEEVDETPDTASRLTTLLERLDNGYRAEALKVTGDLSGRDSSDIEVMRHTGNEVAQFNHWLFELHRESAGAVPLDALWAFDAQLRPIFDRITTAGDGASIWNDLYDRYRINSEVRLCFNIKRRLNTESEVIPEQAHLLLAEKLNPVAQNPRLYPDRADTDKILHMDREGIAPAEPDPAEVQRAYDTMKATLEAQGMGNFVPPFSQFRVQSDHSHAVLSKELTFHYLPYDFAQSGLEQRILEQVLRLSTFKERGLEMYYNGERGLSSFVIRCYAKEGRYWKNVGRYTTDFLIIQRKERNAIHRVLMVETKGRGFANDIEFRKKREYVTSEFLRMNNEKFGYARFDFLYIEDSATPEANLIAIDQRIEQFFDC
jgi:type III restriction enzyme